MTPLNWADLCRLCGQRNGIRVSIFESSPEYLTKIEAVVPDIVILRYDSLPKHVCHRCVAKVKAFYEFRTSCIQTQEEFRKCLPWMSGRKKIEEMSQPGSPIVMFMGGPLAHPFGDPEPHSQPQPEVEVLTLSDDEDSEEVSSSAQVPARTSESNGSSTSAHGVWNAVHLSDSYVHGPVMEPVSSSMGNLVKANVPVHSSIQSSRCLQAAGASSAHTGLQESAATSYKHQSHFTHAGPSSSKSLPPALKKARFETSKIIISQNQLTGSRVSSHTSNISPFTNLVSLFGNKATPENKNAAPLKPRPAPGPVRNFNSHGQTLSSGIGLTQTNDKNRSGLSVSSVPCAESNTKTARQLFHGPAVTIGKRVTQEEPKTSNIAKNQSPYESSGQSASVTNVTKNQSPHESGGQSAPSVTNITKSQSPHESSGQSAPSVKMRKERPKPKCKKRQVKTEVTEGDFPRICQQYPFVNPVRTYDNQIIYACTSCNMCMINEEAVSSHKCWSANSDNMNDKTDIEDGSKGVLSHTDDTSHPKLDSIELVISDDENSDCSQTPKHKCNVCGKLFHNIGRLQKHETTHL